MCEVFEDLCALRNTVTKFEITKTLDPDFLACFDIGMTKWKTKSSRHYWRNVNVVVNVLPGSHKPDHQFTYKMYWQKVGILECSTNSPEFESHPCLNPHPCRHSSHCIRPRQRARRLNPMSVSIDKKGRLSLVRRSTMV